jgi:hypothetical protein
MRLYLLRIVEPPVCETAATLPCSGDQMANAPQRFRKDRGSLAISLPSDGTLRALQEDDPATTPS